jgi:hypothetical protein
MENKIHDVITIYKNNRCQAFRMSEVLLIKDELGLKVKVKLLDEVEYTRVHFAKSPQEGDVTTPCADGSIWRYENKKWTQRITDPSTAIELAIEFERERDAKIRELEQRLELEREESIKRKKDFINFIYASLILALACIGLIDILSRLF